MMFVVIGTDHRMQNSEHGFEALLRSWIGQKFFEPLEAIAEEYHENIGESCAQRLANEHHLRWYNLDIDDDEKRDAGILEEQRTRSEAHSNYRIPSDDEREARWVQKLTNSGHPTTLVVCGYAHFESLAGKLCDAGHTVDRRVYLETVPEITATNVPKT